MMTETSVVRAIGLMSGTSLDGIDAAVIETDGRARVVTGPGLTLPYDDALRSSLRAALGRALAPAELVAALTRAHAEAVETLLARHAIARDTVDVIGFHGHTILHRPEARLTVQIGDGALLAALTGIDVVNDLRSADVAAGGQGAPLVPVYHRALASALPRPAAIVNIGGVANVTWIGADASDTGDGLLAFDTGPGNAPIDDWTRRTTGQPVDQGGQLAASGRIDDVRLRALLAHPYFDRLPPKSLDRNDFTAAAAEGLGAADGAATLTAFTAAAIARAAEHFPAPPRLWALTGGGRHNPVLCDAIRRRVGSRLVTAEEVGWDGDALEAQAFAYLAVRSRRGLALSFPSTTGVPRPLTGGRLHPRAE